MMSYCNQHDLECNNVVKIDERHVGGQSSRTSNFLVSRIQVVTKTKNLKLLFIHRQSVNGIRTLNILIITLQISHRLYAQHTCIILFVPSSILYETP